MRTRGDAARSGVQRRGARAARRLLALVTVILVGLSGAVVGAIAPSAPAAALSGSSFDPGNIISDQNFYDAQAMSTNDIQSFLNAQIGRCTNGRCLNVASVIGATRGAVSSPSTGNQICAAISGGSMAVSEWIYRVQVACGISARVILVTLQKEQGLVTSTAPGDWALAHAMGMACPDTAPCDDAFAGLATQILTGTQQLKTYKAANFAKQPGYQYIQYSPNASCGGTYVNVRSYGTAALYSYTPYQPNAAALSNLSGTGDGCSSYGNRNFWVKYNQWFGDPLGSPYPATNLAPVAAARNAAGQLILYVGDGRGGWKAAVTDTGSWADTRLLAVGGDFNADGTRDVLTVTTTGDLWLHPTDGYSRFTNNPATRIGTGWSSTTAIVVPGDVTGDGRDDLLGLDSSGVLRLYPGLVAGGVGAGQVVAGDWTGTTSLIAVGDFDGDGRRDIATIDAAGRLWLHPGDLAGGFRDPVQIGTGWNGMSYVGGIGDFDGDGAADLVARVAATDQLWLYRGDGRGGWRNGYVIGNGWNSMPAMAASAAQTGPYSTQVGFGDVDGDGPRDVLALQGGTLWNYRGVTGGYLGPRMQIAGDWSNMLQFFNMGDLDGDGYRDALAIDKNGQLWRYSMRGGQLTNPILAGTGWNGFSRIITPGDFNGDGVNDLLAVDSSGRLWLYTGPTFNSVQIGNGFNVPTALIGAGDFDHDGAADVLVEYANGDLYDYRGDGRGGWATTFPKIGTGWSGFDMIVGPGDFDSDGLVDLLARKPNGDLWLYPSNGRGDWKPWRQAGVGWGAFRFIG